MTLKNINNPITPSLRFTNLIDKSDLWKKAPLKILTTTISTAAGRNNMGHITVRHKARGHKKSFRIIDFKRNKYDLEAVVERIEYDPNRSAFIALIKYSDGVLSYIIAPHKLNVGDKILSSKGKIDIKIGNSMPLSVVPIGSIVHNIELKPGAGATLSRSAGTYAQIISKDNGYALIRLSSGEIRQITLECFATIGSVSNPDRKNISYGKAGRMRWLGIRPTVRGVAMNPVDHPHGGGEGKTSGGRHPVSYTGTYTKGQKTRSPKKLSSKFIVKARKGK